MDKIWKKGECSWISNICFTYPLSKHGRQLPLSTATSAWCPFL